MKIGYFGSSKVSIYVLDELKAAGFTPAMIVTTPDKPQGRGMRLAPNVCKSWAIENKVKCHDGLDIGELRNENCGLFIVASYGKILPSEVVFMPKHKTLNVHPSLLPEYRGAAPLPTTMLDDRKSTGVTIMRMDEKMDHGPIVATKDVAIGEWPTYEEFEELMAREGGKLLAGMLDDWVSGKIDEREQDHSKATFTKKIKKEDAEIDLKNGDPYANFRKIQAYHEWPQAYFYATKKSDEDGKRLRVKVTRASWNNGELSIEKVIPEGGREMAFSDLANGYLW